MRNEEKPAKELNDEQLEKASGGFEEIPPVLPKPKADATTIKREKRKCMYQTCDTVFEVMFPGQRYCQKHLNKIG